MLSVKRIPISLSCVISHPLPATMFAIRQPTIITNPACPKRSRFNSTESPSTPEPFSSKAAKKRKFRKLPQNVFNSVIT
jgi:hypothetical protein